MGITMVAAYAIFAGIGEILVGLTGNYLGILSRSIPPALSTVVIGAFYSLGGLSLLMTRKKWGAVLSIIFIGAEVFGLVCLVATGIAPSHGPDAINIVIGGAIALGLIFYIGLKWKCFV